MEDVARPPRGSRLLPWLGRYGPVIVTMAAIFGLSSVPGQSLPPGSLWSYDKFLHALEYAFLSVLWARALARESGFSWLVVGIVALYGVSDELHQSFTPGRDASGLDVVADAVGAVLGAAVYAAWLWFRKGRSYGHRP